MRPSLVTLPGAVTSCCFDTASLEHADDAISKILVCFAHPERIVPVASHSTFWRASHRSEAWGHINLSECGYHLTDDTVTHVLQEATISGAHVKEMQLLGCIHVTDKSFCNLGACHQLRKLSLDGTVGFRQAHITDRGIAAVAATCPNLEELVIRRATKVTSNAIVDLAASACAAKLTSVDLLGCLRIDDEAVGALGGCTALHSLSLSCCKQVTSAGLQMLLAAKPAPSLVHLHLDACMRIDDAGLHAIGEVAGPTLHTLSIEACLGVTDAGISALAAASELRSLNVSGCKNLTAHGLLQVAAAGNLEELSMERLPKLKADQVIELVQKLPKLRKLRKSMLNDRALGAICSSLPELRELAIGASRPNGTITNDGLSALTQCSKLRTLELCGLHKCSKICDVVTQLLLLERLDIRGCISEDIAGFQAALQPDSNSLLRLCNLTLTLGDVSVLNSIRSNINVVAEDVEQMGLNDCTPEPFNQIYK